jgi:hypothetical protein
MIYLGASLPYRGRGNNANRRLNALLLSHSEHHQPSIIVVHPSQLGKFLEASRNVSPSRACRLLKLERVSPPPVKREKRAFRLFRLALFVNLLANVDL